METYSKFNTMILSILLLSACGGTASTTPETAMQGVYTAAAMTLSAQESPAVTSTAIPTIVLPTTQVLPTINALPTTTVAPLQISYSLNSTANGCNNAIYISDVTIPDGTVLASGEAFTKTWRFQNTGTCNWNKDYMIVFISGSPMDGVTTEIDQAVVTGATGDISVSLIAPTTAGAYSGYWRLADGTGRLFGQSVYVQIVVSNTSTATTTTTTESVAATATSTPTPEPTTEPTGTPIPTTEPTE